MRSKVTMQWPYLRGPTTSQSGETITDTAFLWLNPSLLTDDTLRIIVDRCFSNTRTICTLMFVFHCFVFKAIRNTLPFVWTLFICLSRAHHPNQNVEVHWPLGVNSNWILVCWQVSPRLVQFSHGTIQLRVDPHSIVRDSTGQMFNSGKVDSFQWCSFLTHPPPNPPPSPHSCMVRFRGTWTDLHLPLWANSHNIKILSKDAGEIPLFLRPLLCPLLSQWLKPGLTLMHG